MSELSATKIIKVFLSLGVVAIFLGCLIPVMLIRELKSERTRFTACLRHERIDCNPSWLWSLMK